MLNETEKSIINQLQLGIPITHRPFQRCAKQFDLSEQQLIDMIKSLKQRGYISRFGPLFDVEKMGGLFCLCAVAVDESCWEPIAKIINAYPEVAHNYLREHEFNLWFVLACENQNHLDQTIKNIESETGCSVLALPKEREYFVQLFLEV
ncbi:MAG: AsnC family protein [Gammaproteobacteria bacterium CG22_combo_CG10-13_8_21_14_all_40_8]|nr:MAG: AsnC family protein [Gammaproteobacteria bacterium CG22_combo_CG10-13_8_21_14_all_40_8]